MLKSILIALSLPDVLRVLIVNCIQVTVLPMVTMSCSECAACFLILQKWTATHWSHIQYAEILRPGMVYWCRHEGFASYFLLLVSTAGISIFVTRTSICSSSTDLWEVASIWGLLILLKFGAYVEHKTHGLCSAGYIYSLDLDNRNGSFS